MRYMLDTNISIHLIQRQPPVVVERFKALNRGDVVMSVVTLAELRQGVEHEAVHRPQAEAALGRLESFIPALPFDRLAAMRDGEMAAAVRDRRRDALDRLIAAHAASLSLVLVTTNLADFKGYPGLALENWIDG